MRHGKSRNVRAGRGIPEKRGGLWMDKPFDMMSFINDNNAVNEIRHYVDGNGNDLFAEWYGQIRDAKVRIAVDRRIMRVELGNFGDHKYLRDGVWELRIDVGQGYRVYFTKADLTDCRPFAVRRRQAEAE
jgi:putative addiction module killer protein